MPAILGSKCEIPSQLNRILSKGSEVFSYHFFRQFPFFFTIILSNFFDEVYGKLFDKFFDEFF